MKYEEPMMDITVLKKRNVVTIISGLDGGNIGSGGSGSFDEDSGGDWD